MTKGELVMQLREIGYYYPKRAGLFSTDKFWALQAVSLSLHKGESLGIIGKNGSGKSTLLRLLAGLVRPDRGEMVNLGYTASLLTLQAGFVRHLSGRENALLSGMILGMKKTLIRDKMELIKDFSELGDFFEQPISTYSSGMRARLGFSIAFQLDPDILLIDEVLGVGDELFKKKSKRMLRRKILSNKTVVLVSHSAATIRELCDRAVWIHAGSSKVEGPADEVVALYLESLENGVTASKK